jgi:rod shape-determining protein MreC
LVLVPTVKTQVINVHRKQIRRRRAVLALLVIGTFALLISTAPNPLLSVGDRALKPARDLVNWFDETFDAKDRNERLQSELEVTRKVAIGKKAAVAENAELRKLVELDRSGAIPSGYDPVTGRVIVRSPTVWFADVVIDVGSGEGVEVDDPVVSGDGLVGTVTAVTGNSARVTLIVDHSSAVSAKIVPSGIKGLMKPMVGDPEDLILDFLDSEEFVGKGQLVVTAGWRTQTFESGYPPNLPIGEVVEASLREQEAQQQVHIRPFADLRNLDLVQVLTGGSRG